MPNPEISSAGSTFTFAGKNDASGNFAPAHFVATSAFISSQLAVLSATAGQATLIVPFSASRSSVTICNRTQGEETIDLGTSNVTPGAGIPIVAGGDRTFTGPGAAGPIYGASPIAGTQVSWVDA